MRMPTTADVFHAILKQHRNELHVFSSYSAPDGDQYGNPEECKMFTEWGFNDADCALIGSEYRWDRNPDKPHERANEISNYWLIVCTKEEEL